MWMDPSTTQSASAQGQSASTPSGSLAPSSGGSAVSRRSLLRAGAAGVGLVAAGNTAARATRQEPAATTWAMAYGDPRNSGYTPTAEGPVRNVKTRWTVDGGEATFSPAVADGRVYVGSRDGSGTVYALDTQSGEPLWTEALDVGIRTAPAVAGATVVVVTEDARLYGLSAETGEIQWSYTELDLDSEESITLAPTVAGATVYVVVPTQSVSGAVHAVDVTDGTQQWVYRTEYWHPNATPAVADGTVYAGFDDRLVALDADVGDELWHYDTAGAVTSPTVRNGAVYIGAAGNIYRLDAETGDLDWRNTDGFAVGPALATDDTQLYYFDAGQLVALGHDGTREWTYAVGGWNSSIPVVAESVVYCWAPEANEVHAVAPTDGSELWTHRLGSKNDTTGDVITPSPALVGTSLYLGNIDGNVYGLEGLASTPTATADDATPAETASPGPGTPGAASPAATTRSRRSSPTDTEPRSSPTGVGTATRASSAVGTASGGRFGLGSGSSLPLWLLVLLTVGYSLVSLVRRFREESDS